MFELFNVPNIDTSEEYIILNPWVNTSNPSIKFISSSSQCHQRIASAKIF